MLKISSLTIIQFDLTLLAEVKISLSLFFLFAISQTAFSQHVINGLITNEDEEEVAFCHVYNTTMGLGKVSDRQGNFSITGSKGDTLKVSYVGYQTLFVILQPEHLLNYLKIVLPVDSILLPSITIYADPNYRVPLNIQGAPMFIQGLSIENAGDPIRAGSIRPGLTGVGGVPVPGATIYGPITYFSKDEQEKRAATEAYKETRETITYQRFIAQDSIKIKLMRLYDLDSAQYDRLIVRLNSQFPGIQKQYNPAEIWNWILSHFDRSVSIIKGQY
ncbi:MAG: hypothetical protein ACI83W_001266 [Marinoscillum sp.]